MCGKRMARRPARGAATKSCAMQRAGDPALLPAVERSHFQHPLHASVPCAPCFTKT